MSSPGWHEARAIAAAAAPALPCDRLTLESCCGRWLAHDVVTPVDIPHCASSAMDGWLTVGPGPWSLGPAPSGAGFARPIVTGGLVPEGSEAVLRSESGAVVDGLLHSTHPAEPQPGQHIRPRASEAHQGEILIAAGTFLNPAHLALAASAGIDELVVHASPEVALVFTGDEIVTAGIPRPGRVRDSFGVQLPQLLGLMGAGTTTAHRVGDDLGLTIEAIREAPGQLIVTTGGTGSSSADHVRPALVALGARLLIDGVAMRPGGPTALAQLPNGQLVLCLPGNPLAAMIAAITIGEPLIAALSGRRPRPTRSVSGIQITGKAGSTRLVPFSLVDGVITPAAWQGSGMLRGLADAAGLLVVPELGTDHGGSAEIIDLPWVRRN